MRSETNYAAPASPSLAEQARFWKDRRHVRVISSFPFPGRQSRRAMKICPKCSFANDDVAPICLWCNTLITEVPSTPAVDPEHPEHAQKENLRKRHAIWRRQLRFAATLYVLAILGTALMPGFIFTPHVLAWYLGAALVVVFAVIQGYAGQFTASFLQGGLSLVLLFQFGPFQPFIFFMLLGHLLLPMLFWHWTELIRDVNR